MADIVVENLKKRYASSEAVDGISLSVKSGEFVVLLGPSGSGKTTLLRCIAGLEKPDAGKVVIGGVPMDGRDARERDISMVPQNYALFPLMTVRQNIAFPLDVRGQPQSEIESDVKDVAQKLGIEKVLDRYPRELSGGEQQRVSIGRAIVRQTNALLMDEPLSNLDAPLRAQLRTELKTLQKELGVTVIYVTHDQAEAMTLGDKIGVINRGRLLQFNTPDEVYNNPSSGFVARFIGNPASNMMEATASREGARTLLNVLGSRLLLPDQLAQRLTSVDRRMVLAVRPEDIKLSGRAEENAVEVEVFLVEPLGASTIVDVKAGGLLLKVLVEPEFETKPGDRLWAKFNLGKAHLFDAETDLPMA